MRKIACATVVALAGVMPAPSPGAAPPPAPAAGEYRLGTGDKVRITVFGEPALSGEVTVDPAGHVPLPLVGDVEAGGATPAMLRQRIVAALGSGFVRSPRVAVEVLTYRPFYILGEVNRPGEYPFVSGLTVMSAVAQAQGFTYRASTRRMLVRRAGAAREVEQPLEADTPVAPGDTIRIKERWF